MRRVISIVLIGLGIFLACIGLLVRFQVAPKLITAPADTYSKSTLVAENARYLDVREMKMVEGATLTATNTVRGDVKATEAAEGDTTVYDGFLVVEDLSNGAQIDIKTQRVAFDNTTGELTNCCGVKVNDDTAVKMSGVAYFWGMNLDKEDKQVFDSTTKRSWPATFEGEGDVNGVKTHKYVAQIPLTKLDTVVPDLPGKMFGLDTKDPVKVERHYAATVTYQVDPITGSPLDQVQKVTTMLKTADGAGELTVGDFELRMTDESNKVLSDKAEDNHAQVTLVKSTVPLGAIVLGVLLVIIGLVLELTGRGGAHSRRSTAGSAAPQTPAGASKG